MTQADIDSIFSRLERLSLTSSLPTALPDFSHYDLLAAASNSQFIYFTRLSQDPTPNTEEQQYYVPFFTDNFHTLLHEIANYNDLKGGVGDIKGLSLKMEGTEVNGGFTELDLGLNGISSGEEWERALGKLKEMGFGNNPPAEGPDMGEGVVVVVELA